MFDDTVTCPKCGSQMRWKFLENPQCENCLNVLELGSCNIDQQDEKIIKTFDDYIASVDWTVTSSQYTLMELAWNAAVSALNNKNSAQKRSELADCMQYNKQFSTTVRAKEDTPDLKIIRDQDGYLYVWEKVRTQWKMSARYHSWTDLVNSLLDK